MWQPHSSITCSHTTLLPVPLLRVHTYVYFHLDLRVLCPIATYIFQHLTSHQAHCVVADCSCQLLSVEHTHEECSNEPHLAMTVIRSDRSGVHLRVHFSDRKELLIRNHKCLCICGRRLASRGYKVPSSLLRKLHSRAHVHSAVLGGCVSLQ